MNIRALPTGILFAALTDQDWEDLFAGAKRRRFTKGQTIFTRGETGKTVILIETGRVEISITSLAGRKSVLAHMGAGEVLGEIAALDGGERSADAVATTIVEGLALSRDNILSFVAARPTVAQAIIEELCRKVRNASAMFTTQSATEGGSRLAQALLRLFDKWGVEENGELRLSEKFSQSEIGDFSGLARENVNRHLKAWQEAAILRNDNRHLILLDRSSLEDIAAA